MEDESRQFSDQVKGAPSSELPELSTPERRSKKHGRAIYTIGAIALLGGGLIVANTYRNSLDHQSPAPVATTIEATPAPTATAEPTLAPTPKPTETAVAPLKIETQTYPDSRFEYSASWVEDFSTQQNGPINSKNWNIITGPPIANQEKEYYSDSTSNVRIENGLLILQAEKQQTAGFNYVSGRIDTLQKKDFQYGKIEVSAKLPVGVGTWPAIWLSPSKNIYNGRPIPANSNKYYVDGEIDMAETSGIDPNNIYCIAHSLIDPINSPYPNKYYSTLKVPDSNTAFHTYGVSWTPDKISFTIDDKECYSVTKSPTDDYTRWPYDQPYHLILNLAIGGKWYTGDPKVYPPDGIDQSMFPVSMQVKSIRYFEYVAPQ